MSRPNEKEVGVDVHRMLITGGAGFVGANLAVMFRQSFPGLDVVVFDNLARRGSELNLPRLREHGVTFIHGDIRCPEDIAHVGPFDMLIDCAAEPSVQAGLHGSPAQVLHINLVGTLNTLEAARRQGAPFLLLSTSRVYPVRALNSIPWHEDPTRYAWNLPSPIPGVAAGGITEEFTLDGPRSFYGASKLACELLAEEYAYSYGLPALVNRCGIITGPWQMGKVDQGVISLWVARHHFGQPLQYIGYEGSGKQVRDILDVADLFDLIVRQIDTMNLWDGRRYNVGGGAVHSVSLLELTDKCQTITGNTVSIATKPETSPVDLRIFITQAVRAETDFGWVPLRTIDETLQEIHRWIVDHEDALRHSLGV